MRIFQFRYKSIVQFVRKDWKSVLIYRFFFLLFSRDSTWNLVGWLIFWLENGPWKKKKISIRLCSRCQKRGREFLYSSRVRLRRVGLNSLRFRLRRFASLSPLCQRPLTSSTRFLLLLLALPPASLAPPPSPTILVPPRLCYSLSFSPIERSLLWRLSRVSPLVHLAIPGLPPWLLGRLVTWLLGYQGGEGKRTPVPSVRGFLRN